MRTRTIIYLVLALVAVIVTSFWLMQPKPTKTKESTRNLESISRPAPRSGNTRVEEDSDPTTRAVSKRLATQDKPEKPERSFKFRASEILATVNGATITGKDLVPSSAKDPDAQRTTSETQFQYLLKRAIERELTFQDARAKGIELTPAQQVQLEAIRNWVHTRDSVTNIPTTFLTRLNNGGVTPDEQAEFDVRDATGFLLQNSLLEAAGAPSPHVTSLQVEEYYKIHAAQYGALPADPEARAAAWRSIDIQIRQDIAFSTRQAYQERLRQYLEQLKSAASITTNEPSS